MSLIAARQASKPRAKDVYEFLDEHGGTTLPIRLGAWLLPRVGQGYGYRDRALRRTDAKPRAETTRPKPKSYKRCERRRVAAKRRRCLPVLLESVFQKCTNPTDVRRGTEGEPPWPSFSKGFAACSVSHCSA